MKRINQYKKLFQVEGEIDLEELKTSYRTLVKEWHPDKHTADDTKKEEAEEMSRQLTDGYAFLISIAPETIAKGLDEYNETINNASIEDLHHKSMLLEVTFTDGSTYEYFGVNKTLFSKLVNADKMQRFARRNIFNSFTYRKSKRTVEQE
ncbi:MAG TPA: molecular chaperone DnaJ [Bacteroidetes bacterium]|jgi:DnaJ-class molecular chaperone|nr:molecular chaperone DnaJ [Bacteroidota bacterium]